MPSGGKCEEMTEQFSGSCRGEGSGSESTTRGAALGSSVSPLRLLVSPALGKLGSSGAPELVWDARTPDKTETETGAGGRAVLPGERTVLARICAPENGRIEWSCEMGEKAAVLSGKGHISHRDRQSVP